MKNDRADLSKYHQNGRHFGIFGGHFVFCILEGPFWNFAGILGDIFYLKMMLQVIALF